MGKKLQAAAYNGQRLKVGFGYEPDVVTAIVGSFFFLFQTKIVNADALFCFCEIRAHTPVHTTGVHQTPLQFCAGILACTSSDSHFVIAPKMVQKDGLEVFRLACSTTPYVTTLLKLIASKTN